MAAFVGISVLFGVSGIAAAHELDHPAPSFSDDAPLATGVNSGGPGAKWRLVTSFPTGNPHTDLDFFTQGGQTYAAVGTLAAGPNGGGQTIVRLTDTGGGVTPAFVAAHPSASCLSNPASALSLQHDVEATPKEETQLLVDATDAEGRCHDQGTSFGFSGAPSGGLELIDVTDVDDPVEIGLTSHIGEAHTVNVDPKRPHIAYAVSSDAVDLNADGSRQNEDPKDTDRFDLDGFEVIDMSSCMNFPAGTSSSDKRAACRPQVFRYRYPSSQIAMGHSNKGNVYGCHELEIYADDKLTCASGGALVVFDMSGAFDDNGTPTDFTDDRPRGTALPCRVRDSSSTSTFRTGAKVTDCVTGEGGSDLSVAGWLAQGAPSLTGVEYVGSVHHMGRESATGAATPKFPSTEDVDFDHEAEFTASRSFLLATDERGGGVAPPGASCAPAADNPTGNGGIHAYRSDRLSTDGPQSPQQEHQSYARSPQGGKAIYRVRVRTKPQASICTAHVFQQIPGQNRIFMGWYSQGTQVVDFVERPDGSFEWREAGWFIPEGANTWVSHVFKTRNNGNGTFTYWGATGDFSVGEGGRNAIDIYEVTLPAPAQMAGGPAPESAGGGVAGQRRQSCLPSSLAVRSRGLGRVRLGHRRAQIIRDAGSPASSRRTVLRYCVEGGGSVRVALSRRGDARLVATTARRHRSRGIARGSSVRALRRAYPSARRSSAARGVYTTSRSSRIVFKTRRGRVVAVAVADRRLLKNQRLLRFYLRRAGL